jgi:RNA polymerase sigma-70 factor (family 1)
LSLVPNHTTQEWALLFQQGEESAFDFFFQAYYKAVCYFANKYVANLQAAEDIASEAFIRLWESREKIDSEDHLRNFLYRVAGNLCTDHLRRQDTQKKWEQATARTAAGEDNLYFSNIIEAETLRQLKEAIDTLPAQCRKVFINLYVEGKTVNETAEELGLSISTVNNQKARGIKILRSRILCVSGLVPFFWLLKF